MNDVTKNIGDVLILIVPILNIVSVFIFLMFYYIDYLKGNNIRLYILGKFLQAVPLFLLIFLGNSNDIILIVNSTILLGAAVEVYCLVEINNKINLKLKRQLSIITLLALISNALFMNDIEMRIVSASIFAAILFSILFISSVLKQNNSEIQKVIGWFALIFVLGNIFRGIAISTSDDVNMAFFSGAPPQLIFEFSWIIVSFAFPLLFLLKLKENDTIKLQEYKENLESKVRLRTQELEESLEREKELGKLKTRFVAMASHEFRTPLTAINTTTEVIQRYYAKLSKEDLDKRLIKIKNEVSDMTTMLEDILIIGKFDSKKIKFHPKKIDLIEKINAIISEYQLNELEERVILFNSSENEISINADPKWIKHIVLNLLSNAIKYSESDKPVEVNMVKTMNTVEISFKDYGIGIPEEDLEHLFEPFHRGSNVENIPGTGLGINILKKAVELHNGTIAVKSKVGEGSTFTVSIPR